MEADVIRWREPVWAKPSPRAQARRVGERLVTAEVVGHDDARGFVTLLVRACEALSERTGRGQLPLLPPGETVRRRRVTLQRGAPRRLAWSDETVRAQLVRERTVRPPKPRF